MLMVQEIGRYYNLITKSIMGIELRFGVGAVLRSLSENVNKILM